MRNERIQATMRICNLNDMMYHLVTRSCGYMAIFEEHMDLVNINNLKITSEKNNTIQFSDGLNEYNFNISKSTLSKRFDTSDTRKIFGFEVEILDDPYEYLLSIRPKSEDEYKYKVTLVNEEVEDYIVLPLYSPSSKRVEEKSGLNQWNAKGRKRDINEVYIPIPRWVHDKKTDFFNYDTDDNKTSHFNVKLPNGDNLIMKVAQQGGKALMSNPNSALGKWILRDVLQLEEGKILTKEDLDIIGIDSVKLSKVNDGLYNLDFLKSGSFEDFEEEINR